MAMTGQPVRTSISKHHEEKGESATRPMPGATWIGFWRGPLVVRRLSVIFWGPATTISICYAVGPQSEFDPKAGRMNVQTAACVVLVTISFGATFGKSRQYFYRNLRQRSRIYYNLPL